MHDISAIFPNQLRVEIARAADIEVLPEEEAFPMIIHQKLSLVMARDLFLITDPHVLSAIGCHTTLKAGASPLDLVLFVADKIEWDQVGKPPYYEELVAALDLSLESAAFVYLSYMWERREQLRVVHPWLAEAYMELAKSHKKCLSDEAFFIDQLLFLSKT